MNSFDVESLPLRAEEIVQVVVAEQIVNILDAHTCHCKIFLLDIFVQLFNAKFTWRQFVQDIEEFRHILLIKLVPVLHGLLFSALHSDSSR